jgi:GNAT superfamily N-acetyltransferase
MNTFFGLVAEYNGEQVAFGGMIIRTIPGDFNSTSYSEADVLNMYTLPDFRRKGISRLVLRGLIDEARRMNISKLALHTTTSGEKLYRSLGFDNPSYPYLELKL